MCSAQCPVPSAVRTASPGIGALHPDTHGKWPPHPDTRKYTQTPPGLRGYWLFIAVSLCTALARAPPHREDNPAGSRSAGPVCTSVCASVCAPVCAAPSREKIFRYASGGRESRLRSIGGWSLGLDQLAIGRGSIRLAALAHSPLADASVVCIYRHHHPLHYPAPLQLPHHRYTASSDTVTQYQ